MTTEKSYALMSMVLTQHRAHLSKFIRTHVKRVNFCLKGVHSVYELHISQLTLFLKLHNMVTDLREPTDGGKDKPSERSIHDNQGDIFRLIFY